MFRFFIFLICLFPTYAKATFIGGPLESAMFENLSADPISGVEEGRIYWNTTSNKPFIYDGSVWTEVLIGTNPVPDPLLLGAGSTGAPTYGFSGTSSGFWLDGTNLAMSRQGEQKLTIGDIDYTFENNALARLSVYSTSGGGATLRIRTDGTGSNDPIIEMGTTADANIGRIQYDVSADDMLFYANDVKRFSIDTNSINSTEPYLSLDGTNANPAYSFTSDPDTGIRLSANGLLGLISAGGARMALSSTAITSYEVHRGLAGSESTPTYSFTGDTGTGMYNRSGTHIGLTVNGTNRFLVGTTINRSEQVIQNVDGSESVPAYAFTSATNSGIYLSGTNNVVTTRAGTAVGSFKASAVALIKAASSANTIQACWENTAAGLYEITECNTSSRKIKKNIQPMPDNYSIDQLKPVTFEYKDGLGPDGVWDGFIAEDMHETHPRLTIYDENGDPESVKYQYIVAILTHELQKLKARVAELESE